MTAPKLTGWYGGDQKPKRTGVYIRQTPNGDVYFSVYLLGGGWGVLRGSEREAAIDYNIQSSMQSLPWRGLASKP